MILAAVNQNAAKLRMLTDQLLSVYPGAVIYAFAKPADLMECIRTHKLHGVFLEIGAADARGLALLDQIRQVDTVMPVVICAEDDSLLEEAMWNGATAFHVKPMQPEQIRLSLAAQ